MAKLSDKGEIEQYSSEAFDAFTRRLNNALVKKP
jgi:hypothetical protein